MSYDGKKILTVGILGMVMANKAIYGAFYTACWMSWRRQDVEVKVHFLLEGFCFNLGSPNHYYNIKKIYQSEGLLSAA